MNPESAIHSRGTPAAVEPPAVTGLPRTVPGNVVADGLIHRLNSILDPVDLAALFVRPLPVEVELGCGDGSFLTDYARAHPESNFLGVERLLGRLRKTARKGARVGLRNLRLVRIEAAYFLEFLLPSASIQALHVYFPDPWPKRKHRRHRLVNERFPQLAARTLIPGGRVCLRTDHEDYFEQMTRVFGLDGRFTPVATADELSRCRTDFEAGFAAAGISIHRAAYQFRAASDR